MQNETVSDTLLDKFNNITANNTMSDRIITRVTIRKDSLHKLDLKNDNKSQLTQYQQMENHQQIKYATMNARKKTTDDGKELNWSRSQESIFAKGPPQLCVRRGEIINQFDDDGTKNKCLDGNGDPCNGDSSTEGGLTLGISIVQGSDNNVYVKDLVKNGPGARSGIQIGDQVSGKLHQITNKFLSKKWASGAGN